MKKKSGKFPRHMIATTAIHQLGDISRERGDLCTVDKIEGENYVGQWVTGMGFIEVKFPIKTTRELTAKEKKRWNGQRVGIAGSWSYKIKV